MCSDTSCRANVSSVDIYLLCQYILLTTPVACVTDKKVVQSVFVHDSYVLTWQNLKTLLAVSLAALELFLPVLQVRLCTGTSTAYFQNHFLKVLKA